MSYQKGDFVVSANSIHGKINGEYRYIGNVVDGGRVEFYEGEDAEAPLSESDKQRVSAFVAEAVSAGKTMLCVLALAVLFLASGCNAVKTLAEGISEKSLSGSGTVSIQRVGVDPETNTPVLKSTVITGDYASARSGDHALQYRRKKSPSIFNKDAVTEELTINFIGTKEQAAAALDLAKQDATAAAASPGLEKPEATTATTAASTREAK